MTAKQLHAHQMHQLQILLQYVSEHSPYYQERVTKPQSFESYPKMSKAVMMENFNSINTEKLKKEELFEFMTRQRENNTLRLFREQYSVGLSSGTSGNKGLTVLSKQEMQDYSVLLWARKGIPSHIKKIQILFALRVNNPSFMEVGKFGIKLVYVDYNVPVEEIIAKINELHLNIIAGPPSLLLEIAKQKANIEQKVDAIISYAEILYPETKKLLETEFHAPVTQIYQGSEGFIASTCKNGKLHMNEDILLIQLEDTEYAEIKKVVITDLYRTTQPIIKYELNDMIELDTEGCTCGSVFRVIKTIHGRTDDIFYLKHSTTDDNVLLFPDYIRRSIIFASDAIKEYQAIQYNRASIEIRLVIENGDIQQIQQSILSNLQKYADKIRGELSTVEFSQKLPEVHPISNKLIRVWRRY